MLVLSQDTPRSRDTLAEGASYKGSLCFCLETRSYLLVQTIDSMLSAMPELNPAFQLDSVELLLLSDFLSCEWPIVVTP